MQTDLAKIKEQLTHVLALVEPAYVNALLVIQRRLAKNHVDYAVGGNLAAAFRTVQIKPDCIELFTSKEGAAQIFLEFKEHCMEGVYFQTQKLSRKAIVNGKELPVYERSHYFDFTLDGVNVKVHGNPQLRIGEWPWGDVLSFTPDYIYVVGVKTALVPLQVQYEIYQGLGWTDQVEKIGQVLEKRLHPPR